MLKSTALLALTAVFLIATVINSGPAAVHWRQIALFSIATLMTAVLFIAFANLGAELSLKQAIVDPSFWACVSWVALVGSGAVLVLHRLLRRARLVQRQIFRLAVPLCAALLAATVYSLHCPVDALAYLCSAYLLAIALVVSFSLLLSRRLWRW
ncbi:NrsF family protein [Alishewanella longhuensis]